MRADVDVLSDKWADVTLTLSRAEIQRLIELLQALAADPSQHFHATYEPGDSGRVVDLGIAVDHQSAVGNVSVSGLAIDPQER